jgi:hypothetical protein
MMPRNRAENAANWDIEKLVAILLRQFKRLLSERGVELTEAGIQRLAGDAANRTTGTDPVATGVRRAMTGIVEESLAQLAAWDLDYARALATPMDQMPGWETTADFLELANAKGNAELRISAGASLLAFMGDTRFAGELLACYDHGRDDFEDVDAVIARRALAFASGLAPESPDWRERIGQFADRTRQSTD